MVKNELTSTQWFKLYESVKELSVKEMYPIKNMSKEDYKELLEKLRENAVFKYSEEKCYENKLTK